VTEQIAWGIMSSGRMAGDFAQALSGVPDARLVAVGSRTEASAQSFASQFSVPNIHHDYSSLVNDPEVDVVYIATPHSSHMNNTVLALEANKHVLCEKPFAINAGEAESLIALAREKQLFLMEAMWTRYIPAVIKLKELLDARVIGNVQMVLAGGAYLPAFDPDHYLFNRDLGGGVLLDAGVYLVSMASYLLGHPSDIRALGQLGDTGVDEHEAILLGHDSGAIASLYVSLRGTSSPDLTLIGDRGKIYLHAPIFCPSRITVTAGGKEEVFDMPFHGNGYQFEIIEVGRCLGAGQLESAAMPLDETLQIMRTMDVIREQLGMSYSSDTRYL
jgi:predicted dehydrogenase